MAYLKIPLSATFSVTMLNSVYHFDMKGRRGGAEWHDFPELFYVERGTHRVLVDGELFHLSAGEALIYAPNSHHAYAGPSEALVNIVSFETDFPLLLHYCNRVLTPSAEARHLLSRAITEGLYHLSHEDNEGSGNFGWMRIKNLLELLLIELAQEMSSSAPAGSNRENAQCEELLTITAYFKKNLYRQLTLDEIAAHFSLSISKLKALCHAQLGCGPITYFLSLKVGEAKRLIRSSSLTFTEIAERLGFGSIHHFSKFFKNKTGLTPSEYAKAIDQR